MHGNRCSEDTGPTASELRANAQRDVLEDLRAAALELADVGAGDPSFQRQLANAVNLALDKRAERDRSMRAYDRNPRALRTNPRDAQ